MPKLTTIAFDADDTLWGHEQYFRLTETRFRALLADHASPEALGDRLLAAERRNIAHYGFGVKAFTLSMIETALEITEHQVPGTVIAEILAAGREMLVHPVETLPYVDQVLTQLGQRFRLILITKGDLFDQERKLAASGLAEHFSAVEIVSDKVEQTYRRIFDRHTDGADRTLMVGNSLKSDILPALAAGSYAVYVPAEFTWVLDHADEPVDNPRYRNIASMGDLPGVIAQIETT